MWPDIREDLRNASTLALFRSFAEAAASTGAATSMSPLTAAVPKGDGSEENVGGFVRRQLEAVTGPALLPPSRILKSMAVPAEWRACPCNVQQLFRIPSSGSRERK